MDPELIETNSKTTQRPRSYQITGRDVVIDENLPAWARRSNPVVRRELGQHWKRIFPDLGLLARVLGIQAGLILVMPITPLMTITLPIAVVAVVIVPVALFLYGRVIITVIDTAATAMVQATTHHTLDLLRVSLVPVRHLVLGKVAASLWKRMEDIDLVMVGIMIGAMPVLTVYTFSPYDAADITFTLRLMAMMGILVAPIRALLEPFMLGALAVAAGTLSPTRAGAVVSVSALAVFYYVLAALPYIARPGPVGMLLGTVLLPVLVPLLVGMASVRFAAWRINRM